MKSPAVLLKALLSLILAPVSAFAFDYRPTPLPEALAAHDLVLVGTVSERGGGHATVAPVAAIKGDLPASPLKLPDTWRPGSEFTFGPVVLEAGKTYLLMLNKGPDGAFALSRDFAAPAVAAVSPRNDPLVRAATVLYSLSLHKEPATRRSILAAAGEKESDETKLKLLDAFSESPADAATVPFLLDALNAAGERSSLAEWSAIVLLKHKYREAIPGLLKVLQSHEGSRLYAARALGAMKVPQAYEPTMKLIENPAVGNRPYFIEALTWLEDKRATPFLISILHRNLPDLDPAQGTYRSWSIQENEFAVEGLGRLRAAEAVDPLLRLLELGANYNNLRTRAIQSLGAIGPPARRALPRIRAFLPDPDFREIAEQAIAKIEPKDQP